VLLNYVGILSSHALAFTVPIASYLCLGPSVYGAASVEWKIRSFLSTRLRRGGDVSL
jgi:hypothetical protein